MDLDFTTDCVFWADKEKDEVFVEKLLKLNTRETSLADSVEGIFLHHIAKILNFVDGSRKTIELLSVAPKGTDANGVKHMPLRNTILIKDHLGEMSKPRGFVVHPIKVIFYHKPIL